MCFSPFSRPGQLSCCIARRAWGARWCVWQNKDLAFPRALTSPPPAAFTSRWGPSRTNLTQIPLRIRRRLWCEAASGCVSQIARSSGVIVNQPNVNMNLSDSVTRPTSVQVILFKGKSFPLRLQLQPPPSAGYLEQDRTAPNRGYRSFQLYCNEMNGGIGLKKRFKSFILFRHAFLVVVRRHRVFFPFAFQRWCRTLLVLVLTSRVFSTSNASRSPLRISSGSIPADCSAVTWRNISGPPVSSALKPNPRSAFHIFSLPVAIPIFPFSIRSRPGDGWPRGDLSAL